MFRSRPLAALLETPLIKTAVGPRRPRSARAKLSVLPLARRKVASEQYFWSGRHFSRLPRQPIWPSNRSLPASAFTAFLQNLQVRHAETKNVCEKTI